LRPSPSRIRVGAPGSPLAALPGTAASGRMDLLTVVLHDWIKQPPPAEKKVRR
jgi:hypothetical protein